MLEFDFTSRSRRILRAIEEATIEAGDSSARVRGRLRVNVDPSIGQFMPPPRLQPFLAQHPDQSESPA